MHKHSQHRHITPHQIKAHFILSGTKLATRNGPPPIHSGLKTSENWVYTSRNELNEWSLIREQKENLQTDTRKRQWSKKTEKRGRQTYRVSLPRRVLVKITTYHHTSHFLVFSSHDLQCRTWHWFKVGTAHHTLHVLREDCSRPKCPTFDSRKCAWTSLRTNPHGRWRWRSGQWNWRWVRRWRVQSGRSNSIKTTSCGWYVDDVCARHREPMSRATLKWVHASARTCVLFTYLTSIRLHFALFTVSLIFHFILLIFHFIFSVGRFGENSPVLFVKKHPSHK